MSRILAPMLRRGDACVECRRRKLRCNGDQPTCDQCQRSHRQCNYERPVTRPVILVLQERLASLEEKFNSLLRKPQVAEKTLDFPPEMTGKWWEQEELAPSISKFLVGVFVTHRNDCLYNIDPSRLFNASDASEQQAPHRGLMEAVYLLACSFTSRYRHTQSLQRLESHFLARARKALNDSLSYSDRLLDFIRGSNLVCYYLFIRGRLLESYHMHCGTSRFALSCGLHQIISPVFRENTSVVPSSQSICLLPPPADQQELAERIFTWWQVYVLDQLGSIATGFASSLPGDNDATAVIQTVLPREREDYQTGNVNDLEYQTVRDMYQVPSPEALLFRRPDSRYTLYIKALTLFSRSLRLSAEPRASDAATFLQMIQEMDQANTRLRLALPPVEQRREQPPVAGQSTRLPAANQSDDVDIWSIMNHNVVHGVTIELMNSVPNLDARGYQARLCAAREEATLIKCFSEEDFLSCCITYGHTWFSAAKALAQHIATLKARTPEEILAQEAAQELEGCKRDLEILCGALKKFKDVYPAFVFHERQLQQIMAALGMAADL